jgi:catechol 2,3-dioxygenase-like lactoylglutathione lyase family enzyme
MDHRLEAIIVPVRDVDRARAFYEDRCGWTVDVDDRVSPEMRVVQLTPPGSACSVLIGEGLSDAAPGTYRGTHLVVADVVAAAAELAGRGVEVEDVRHMTPEGFRPGPDPERRDFWSYSGFADPDGNTWVLQEKGYGRGEG